MSVGERADCKLVEITSEYRLYVWGVFATIEILWNGVLKVVTEFGFGWYVYSGFQVSLSAAQIFIAYELLRQKNPMRDDLMRLCWLDFFVQLFGFSIYYMHKEVSPLSVWFQHAYIGAGAAVILLKIARIHWYWEDGSGEFMQWPTMKQLFSDMSAHNLTVGLIFLIIMPVGFFYTQLPIHVMLITALAPFIYLKMIQGKVEGAKRKEIQTLVARVKFAEQKLKHEQLAFKAGGTEQFEVDREKLRDALEADALRAVTNRRSLDFGANRGMRAFMGIECIESKSFLVKMIENLKESR